MAVARDIPVPLACETTALNWASIVTNLTNTNPAYADWRNEYIRTAPFRIDVNDQGVVPEDYAAQMCPRYEIGFIYNAEQQLADLKYVAMILEDGRPALRRICN